MASPSSQRKVQIAIYAVPAVVSFGLAVSNYLQQSFGIYLKYQALVDSYYVHTKGGSPDVLGKIQDKQKLIMEQLKQTSPA